ncbi:MAG: DnaJ domain-containing protein [Ignavibacteriales bacterium]
MLDNPHREKEIISVLNQMQNEILRIGWLGIAKKYHPDVNPDEPLTEEKFKVYRAVYEYMKEKYTG